MRPSGALIVAAVVGLIAAAVRDIELCVGAIAIGIILALALLFDDVDAEDPYDLDDWTPGS